MYLCSIYESVLWILSLSVLHAAAEPESADKTGSDVSGSKLPSLYNQRYLEQGGYIQQNQYISDWGSEWSENNMQIHHNKPKCVTIPPSMGLCHSLRYKKMRLPNLLGHDSIDEASQQAASWVPLLGVRCFPDTQLFLCSLFTPVCLDRPIWPCRSLCEAVKSNCEGTMQRWGFPWPEMVRCSKFPPDNDLCIKAQNRTREDDSVCAACKKPHTFEVVIDNFCNSQFAIRGRIKRVKIKRLKGRQLFTRLVLKKRKFYKRGDLRKKDLKKFVTYVEHGDKCNCANAKAGKTNYLIMGKRERGKILVTFLVVWPKKNRQFRRALKFMKKKGTCTKGNISISRSQQKPRRRKRKRGRKNRKGGKRRRKNRRKISTTQTPSTSPVRST